MGRAGDALYDANKCTELQPTFVKGWSRVGAALYRLGRFSEAIKAYEKGLEMEGNNADLKKALAEAQKAALENRPLSSKEMKSKLQEFVGRNSLAAILLLPRLFLVINAVSK